MSAVEATPTADLAAASFHLRPSLEPIPLRIHHWEQCHAACNSEGSEDSSSVASTSASAATTSNASAVDSCTSEVRMYHEHRLTERVDAMEDDDEYDDDDDDDDDYGYGEDDDGNYLDDGDENQDPDCDDENENENEDKDVDEEEDEEDPDDRCFGYVLGYGFEPGDEMDCDDEGGEGEDSNRLEAEAHDYTPGDGSMKQTSDGDIDADGEGNGDLGNTRDVSEKVLGKRVAICSICHFFIQSREKFSGRKCFSASAIPHAFPASPITFALPFRSRSVLLSLIPIPTTHPARLLLTPCSIRHPRQLHLDPARPPARVGCRRLAHAPGVEGRRHRRHRHQEFRLPQ